MSRDGLRLVESACALYRLQTSVEAIDVTGGALL
jgi:hypothetical protein